MKFTSFNPLILTSNGEAIIKMYEELGFEKRHTVSEVGGNDVTNVSMTDANGFKVDIANAPNIKQDIVLIRMNVDDFDEAYEFFMSRGFLNVSGRVVESKTSKSAMIKSPSGFAFDLCHHIKE